MNIDLFKSLITVAKYQNVSRASQEIHLTQPAVTKHIKALEEEYGIRLFERKNKRMTLTEHGKRLLNYANRIVSLFNESLECMNEDQTEVKGTLNIGANFTLGIYVLPRLIKLYSDIYPEVKIEMTLENTAHVIRAVKRNDVNFGFIGVGLQDSIITVHLFYQDKMNVVIGKDFGIKKNTVSWKELESVPFIGLERGAGIRDTLEQWLRERNIKLECKMECNNTEAIKEWIHHGCGFSILPWCIIEKEVRTGMFRVLSAPYFDVTQSYYICHYKDKRFSKPEKVFLEFLFQTIESGSRFISSTPSLS